MNTRPPDSSGWLESVLMTLCTVGLLFALVGALAWRAADHDAKQLEQIGVRMSQP